MWEIATKALDLLHVYTVNMKSRKKTTVAHFEDDKDGDKDGGEDGGGEDGGDDSLKKPGSSSSGSSPQGSPNL